MRLRSAPESFREANVKPGPACRLVATVADPASDDGKASRTPAAATVAAIASAPPLRLSFSIYIKVNLN